MEDPQLGLPQLGEWSSATVLSLTKHNEEKKKIRKIGGEWGVVTREGGESVRARAARAAVARRWGIQIFCSKCGFLLY